MMLFRKLTIAMLATFFLVFGPAKARATWSIIIVDTATGEVAIGSATCLTFFDLRQLLPVVIVDVGAAAAQSAIDSGATNRQLIHDQLLGCTPPDDILALLEQIDGAHQSRQYGIVDMKGRASTFTGSNAGAFADGLTGQVGTLVYAIQGNVITGMPVLTEAENAIINTVGDMPEKLMAAMEAARDMGGDGRCSCSSQEPDGCGAPPPDFDKSAHIGFMIVARRGDTDNICNGFNGCAAGDYFMNFNRAQQQGFDPDPVTDMRLEFDQWRNDLVGRPDGIQSTVSVTPDPLPTDGVSTAILTVNLLDWQQSAITATIQDFSIEHAEESDNVTTIGTITDLGNGVFTVELTAGQRAGTDAFVITVDDGIRPVQLAPNPTATVAVPDGALTMADPIPGVANQNNDFCISNGTPNSRIVFAYSLAEGVTVTACGNVGLASPTVGGTAIVDASGNACLTGFVPNAANNRTVFYQGVQTSDCQRSNVVGYTF